MKKFDHVSPELRLAFARTAARKCYCAYVALAHMGMWEPGRLHKFLCDTVQRFLETVTGNPYDILGISVPPQHGKSQAITETLPGWYLGMYPDRRVIEVSYGDNLAGRFGRRNRRKVEEFGPPIFGVRLSKKTSEHEFEIDGHGGGMTARGVMSSIMGLPAELIIIDDPIKSRLEADSEVYRERLWEAWTDSIKSRLAAGGKVILIQTRWHEDDLYGRLEKTDKFFRGINIPCEAEENDPLGRAPGEALAPEIGKDDKWLAAFKESYKDGERSWNALYQGRPSSQEGNILLRRWWKRYERDPSEVEAWCDRVILSVDCSFKDTENGSRVCIQCWGKKYANMYLLDAVTRPMGFSETVKAVSAMKRSHPSASPILVEEKANGAAVIEALRLTFPGVVPVNPKGGKIARAYAVQGVLESGNVYLPEVSDFAGDFIEECASFPYGAFDDRVDCFTQAANRLLTHASGPSPERDPAFPFKVDSGPSAGGAMGGVYIDVV
jgi:predicted phage terminase large subunit-like protein